MNRDNNRLSAKIVTTSGVVIALYVAIMYLTQHFAFGQFQIRVATALYSLSFIYPFLILPLAFANFLSNAIMGGLGITDMVGGFFVGLITSGAISLIKRFGWKEWLIGIPILIFPGLLVPIWLSYLLNVNYLILAPSVLVGQIVPALGGIIIVRRLKGVFPKI